MSVNIPEEIDESEASSLKEGQKKQIAVNAWIVERMRKSCYSKLLERI